MLNDFKEFYSSSNRFVKTTIIIIILGYIAFCLWFGIYSVAHIHSIGEPGNWYFRDEVKEGTLIDEVRHLSLSMNEKVDIALSGKRWWSTTFPCNWECRAGKGQWGLVPEIVFIGGFFMGIMYIGIIGPAISVLIIICAPCILDCRTSQYRNNTSNQNNQEQINQEQNNQNDIPIPEIDLEANEQERLIIASRNTACLACTIYKPNVKFINCNHICLCLKCSKKWQNCCPLCRIKGPTIEII